MFPGVPGFGHTSSELRDERHRIPPQSSRTRPGTAYSWSASPTNPADQTITGKDIAGNSSTATLHFVSDTTIQTAGTPQRDRDRRDRTEGSTSTTASTGFAINSRADYAETRSGTQSGLQFEHPHRANPRRSTEPAAPQAPGGPFTTATTVTNSTQPSGILAGFCYLYTLTGTDNVANSASISTTVTVTDTATKLVLTGSSSMTAGGTNVLTHHRRRRQREHRCRLQRQQERSRSAAPTLRSTEPRIRR